MVLHKLKSETEYYHKLVESSGLMAPITSDKLSIDQYLHILKVFFGYFYPIEIALNQIPELFIHLKDYPNRRKSESIIRDLSFLSGINSSALPICNDIPEIKNCSHAFGVIYVMEGSTLGGRMLTKLIQKQLGISADQGISFFNGYGEHTGEFWKRFQESITSYSLLSNNDDLIIQFANSTFEKLNKWIIKNEHTIH